MLNAAMMFAQTDMRTAISNVHQRHINENTVPDTIQA